MSANDLAGREPIFINRHKYDVDQNPMTGRQILAVAGYGQGYDLFLLQGEGDPSGGRCIGADEEIETHPGLHFRAMPGNCTFGAGDDLPPLLVEDAAKLAGQLGLQVDVEQDGPAMCTIVRQVPLRGYSKERSDILVLTDRQYPASAMDMFYMEEDVRLANGTTPNHASSVETHAGRRWRRWSWHRNGVWTPGIDDLLSHWAFVEACWAREAA